MACRSRSRPAYRIADGPLSTPRRPAPRSIGTPTMPTSTCGRLFTCFVVVEPAARLASEISGRDHLAQQGGRREARLLELVEHDVGDVQRRVQPDEIEQSERTHRVARPQHHADVDVLFRGEALLE